MLVIQVEEGVFVGVRIWRAIPQHKGYTMIMMRVGAFVETIRPPFQTRVDYKNSMKNLTHSARAIVGLLAYQYSL